MREMATPIPVPIELLSSFLLWTTVPGSQWSTWEAQLPDLQTVRVALVPIGGRNLHGVKVLGSPARHHWQTKRADSLNEARELAEEMAVLMGWNELWALGQIGGPRA